MQKRIIGFLMLLLAFAIIFLLTVIDMGFKDALIAWTIASVLAGIIFIGAKLLIG